MQDVDTPREWKILINKIYPRNAVAVHSAQTPDTTKMSYEHVRVIEYSRYDDVINKYNELSEKYLKQVDASIALREELDRERAAAAGLVEALKYAKGQLEHAGYTKNAAPAIEAALAAWEKRKAGE